MNYEFQKALDDLQIAALNKLVDAQKMLIEEQQKEIELCHEAITKLCGLCGIEPPKWEG